MNVHIKRTMNLFEVDPWIPSLDGLLSFRRLVFKFGMGKQKTEFVNEKLYHLTEDGKAQIPSGMFSKVYKELVKSHSVTIEDFRDLARIMPTPDFSRVQLLRPGQDKILLAIAGSDGGLLVGGCGVGKSFIITQTCLMYPTLKIVVVSPRISVVKTIYESLLAVMPSTSVGMAGGGKTPKGKPRVVVSTTGSILKCDLAGCDLLLFDESHNLGVTTQITEKLAYTNARRFGLTASPEGRSSCDDKMQEAIFGCKLVDIDYQEAVDNKTVTPIEVKIVTVPTCGYIPDSKNLVTRRRWAYWRNAPRNRAIADVAESAPGTEQTLIICDVLEHAIALKKLLPKFTLIHGGTVDKDRAQKLGYTPDALKISKDDLEEFRKQFTAGTLRHVIATRIWGEGLNMPFLTLLIRADAGPSMITSEQIPGRLSRLSEGKDKGILVDFDDAYSDWALRRSRARIAFYRKKGWAVSPWKTSPFTA
jgi:superfamily II DNA or RNA helicase